MSERIDIDQLTERVTILRRVDTPDGTGDNATTWPDFKTLWAKVEMLYGRELELAQKISADVTTRFVIAYRPQYDVTEDMRVYWRSQQWNIHAILEDVDERMFMFLFTSRVN